MAEQPKEKPLRKGAKWTQEDLAVIQAAIDSGKVDILALSKKLMRTDFAVAAKADMLGYRHPDWAERLQRLEEQNKQRNPKKQEPQKVEPDGSWKPEELSILQCAMTLDGVDVRAMAKIIPKTMRDIAMKLASMGYANKKWASQYRDQYLRAPAK
jgi:hypothetical protein